MSGFDPKYDLPTMTKVMLEAIEKNKRMLSPYVLLKYVAIFKTLIKDTTSKIE